MACVAEYFGKILWIVLGLCRARRFFPFLHVIFCSGIAFISDVNETIYENIGEDCKHGKTFFFSKYSRKHTLPTTNVSSSWQFMWRLTFTSSGANEKNVIEYYLAGKTRIDNNVPDCGL